MKKNTIAVLLTVIMGSTTAFAYRDGHGEDYSNRGSYGRRGSCCDRNERSSYTKHGRGMMNKGHMDNTYNDRLPMPVAQQQEIAKLNLVYDKGRLEIDTKYSSINIPLYAEKDQIKMQLDNMQGSNKSRADVTKLLIQLNEVDSKIMDVREQERADVRKIKNNRRDAIQRVEIEFLNSIE